MMNIRDYLFINKAKNSNKIKILEILGFESNSYITQSPENIKYRSQEIENNQVTLEEELYESRILDLEIDSNNYDESETNLEVTPTRTFEPIKITSQMKKIWIYYLNNY